MIALLTDTRHAWASRRFVRWWLRTSLIEKLALWFFLTLLVYAISFMGSIFISIPAMFTGALASAGVASNRNSGALDQVIPKLFSTIGQGSLVVCCGLTVASWLLGLFIIFDAFVQAVYVRGKLRGIKAETGATMATRAEYIGSHPKLPQSRFVYLALAGTQAKPEVIVAIPSGIAKEQYFPIPALETRQARLAKSDETMPATEALIGGLTQRSSAGALRGEKLHLKLTYTGRSGRTHEVMFSTFFFGNYEVQTWANAIVCSVEEADTGERPYGIWQSLPVSPAAQPHP